MPNHSQNTTEDQIFEEILKRSATDRDYRARLVAQPSAAIEEVTGVPLSTLPKPINVQFVEKGAGIDALIVLPDFLDAEGSLSEAELEAVAGGELCITSCYLTNFCLLSQDNTVKVCTAADS